MEIPPVSDDGPLNTRMQSGGLDEFLAVRKSFNKLLMFWFVSVMKA